MHFQAPRTPKVLCDTAEEDDEDGEDPEVAEDEEIRSRLLEGQNVFDLPSTCSGALRMQHYGRSMDLKSLRLTKRNYRTFRRLRSRTVYNAEVVGGCCWELGEQSYWQGTNQVLPKGHKGTPRFQPKSARKVACP